MNFKKINKRYAILGLVFLLGAAGVGFFGYSQIKNLVEADTNALLEQITSQQKLAVTKDMDDSFSILESVSGTLDTNDLLNDTNVTKLRGIAEKRGYLRLVLVDADGNARSTDGKGRKLFKDELFHNVMSGRNQISGVFTPAANDREKVVAMAVPVYRNDQAVGVLACLRDTEEYAAAMQPQMSQMQSSSYVFTAAGEPVIFPKDYKGNFTASETAGVDKAEIDSIPELASVREEMGNGKKGIVKYADPKGEIKYLSYEPLRIKDWYLISVIPEKLFDQRLKSIFWIALAAGIGIMVLILVFVGLAAASNLKKQRVVETVAYIDRLTGLANGRRMAEAVSELSGQVQKRTYVSLYVHRFDRINYIFSYAAGSRLLQQMAEVLRDCVSEDELAARVKEDNFALLLISDGREREEARIQEIIRRLEQLRIKEGDTVYDYQCEFKAAIYEIKETLQFEQVQERTLLALGKERESDGSAVTFFDPEMEKQIDLEEILKKDIYAAFVNKEFIPYFQVMYELESGEIVGGEVLVRWNHPEQGILQPSQFLPVLESTGLIGELDMLMLSQACQKQRQWLDSNLLPVPLFVNISRLNFHKEGFLEDVVEIVQKYDIPPMLIALETSERTIQDNLERAVELETRLKKFGLRFAIDNFGLGSQSFQILCASSANTIKLDLGHFYRDTMTQKEYDIYSGIVDITKRLGIEMMAERVETKAQEDFLKKIGCTAAQGYVHSAPVSEEEFEKLAFGE